MRRRSPLVPILLVVVLIGAALFALSRVDPTKKLERVEKQVPENALAK